MLKAGDVDLLRLEGLSRERAAILPGGVAILLAVLDGFGIERMIVADGALREGLIYDLISRRHTGITRWCGAAARNSSRLGLTGGFTAWSPRRRRAACGCRSRR